MKDLTCSVLLMFCFFCNSQRQCLALLSRFTVSDRLSEFKKQQEATQVGGVNKKDEMELAMQQVCFVLVVSLVFLYVLVTPSNK